MQFKKPENQFARWTDVLSTNNFWKEHRSGRLHADTDTLNRLRCECECHSEWECKQLQPYCAMSDIIVSWEKSIDLQTLCEWIEESSSPRNLIGDGSETMMRCMFTFPEFSQDSRLNFLVIEVDHTKPLRKCKMLGQIKFYM